MKKLLSLLLAFGLALCVTVPAFAADAPADHSLVKDAVAFFFETDDPSLYYVRCSATVQDVSDAFSAAFLPDPDFPDDGAPVIRKDDLHIIPPCEENGGCLELYFASDASWNDLTLSGLLDAQGNALDCTIPAEQFQWTYFSVSAISDGIGFFINLYTGEFPLKALLWDVDFDLSQMTDYCLFGDEIFLPELPEALQNRAKLTCDGVTLSQNEDGTYIAVSGRGTVTYEVTGFFRTTKKICVQTEEERRVFTSREAAKHPLVTAVLWLSGATFPAAFLYPVGILLEPVCLLLGFVTLPVGYLAQIIALRYGL